MGQRGLYISNTGMGYATTFSMNIGVVTADFGLTMTVSSAAEVDLSVTGSVYAHIGDVSFGAATIMGFTASVGSDFSSGDFKGHFSGSLDCNGCLADIEDFLFDNIWLEISNLFRAEEDLQVRKKRGRPSWRSWFAAKKRASSTAMNANAAPLEDVDDAQLEDALQTSTKNSWNVKKGVKKVVKTSTTAVVDTANTVTDTIADAATDFADLVTDFFDIKPTLVLSSDLDGDINGWSLKITMKVGVSNSLGDVSETVSTSVAFSVEDMGEAVISAAMNAFDSVVDSFSGVMDTGSRRRRRRGWSFDDALCDQFSAAEAAEYGLDC